VPRFASPAVVVPLRVALAVLGGYGLSAGLVALLAVVLALAGMQRSEAVVLAAMLGFVIYLAVLMWAFAEPRLGRLAAITVAGGGLAHALAYGLA
jgi:hypothetical protein